ncbi:MAG: hypothetical protein KBS59_06585, partial [Clostridiales bacterium]|nr:hypothetical protein [Clostridiales bacterium]
MGIMNKLWFAFCLLFYPVWYAYEQHKKNKNKERILELISYLMNVDGFYFGVTDNINYMIEQMDFCVPQIVNKEDRELFYKFFEGFRNYTITKISRHDFE